MELMGNGLRMIGYILVISFLILGVAAAAVVPFSLDRFLSFLHIWHVSVIILLVLVTAFFGARKIAKWSDERKPKSILDLARQRSLATAGSENLSDLAPSSPEMWLDFIWKPPLSHAKGVADDYLAPLPPLLEEPPTPYDVLPPPPPPSPPPANASYDSSAPAYHAAYDDVPPSPVHTWQDVPSSPAPYSHNFCEAPPSPAAYSWHDVPSSPAPHSTNLYDVPPSPAAYSWYDVPSSPAPCNPDFYDVPPSPAAYSWFDVPSSPAPYSPNFYDVPPSPAAYSWHDVPSSPAYDYLYDHGSSSQANAAAMFSSYRSPYGVAPELFQSDLEQEAVEPWDQDKPLFDRYWNNVPSPRLTHTATAAAVSANFSCSRRFTGPFENEPCPPEVRKEMLHPCHDDNKSIDETWNSIVDGGRNLAKSLTKLQRHEERGHAPAGKKGPKRAEKTCKKEVVAAAVKNNEHKRKNEEERYPTAATRKEPHKVEIRRSKEVAAVGKKEPKKTETSKEETRSRGRDLLATWDRDELFHRAEVLIKKHYDHLRLQRQESAKRRSLEKLCWTS